jgi:Bifunctional DNA primase/polymerase, N-terminal
MLLVHLQTSGWVGTWAVRVHRHGEALRRVIAALNKEGAIDLARIAGLSSRRKGELLRQSRQVLAPAFGEIRASELRFSMRRKIDDLGNNTLSNHRESERDTEKKGKGGTTSEREKIEVAKSGMKERARQYASSLGLRVLPFHTCVDGACTCQRGRACERPGKHPMTAHGVKDGTTNLDQIEKWWTDSPNANIGIATCPESGLLVLDVDPRNGGGKPLPA